MRVSRVLVVLAVLMAVTTASQAQVRALGPGVGVSCGVWLEARTDPEGPLVFGLLSWVLGAAKSWEKTGARLAGVRAVAGVRCQFKARFRSGERGRRQLVISPLVVLAE